MKKLRNNIWFWLGLILISVAIAGGIIFYLTKHFGRVKAPTSTTTSTPTSDEKITTPDVADMRQEVPVPILMYHHIRVYNDSNDSIGTGLSVPPNQFQEEMNYLRDNNFTTINFFDFVNFPASNLPDKPVIVTFDDGYQDAFDNAMPILKMNNQNGVFYIISGFLGRPDFLTTDEVKKISDAGMEIGSHTIDHPDLRNLSQKKLSDELLTSKSTLENIVGKNIISFCYPSGKNNDVVDVATKNAGYLTATTTNPGISTTKSDKYKVPRIRINPGLTITEFEKKL